MTVLEVETQANPRHVALANEFLKRLEAMSPDLEEEVLSLRVVVRHGIARKAKWTREEDEGFN